MFPVRRLGEQSGVLFLQQLFVERTEVSAQGFDMNQEIILSRDPGPAIRAEAARWNQVMVVRMKEQCAGPGLTALRGRRGLHPNALRAEGAFGSTHSH
jgi:hypothetical protein